MSSDGNRVICDSLYGTIGKEPLNFPEGCSWNRDLCDGRVDFLLPRIAGTFWSRSLMRPATLPTQRIGWQLLSLGIDSGNPQNRISLAGSSFQVEFLSRNSRSSLSLLCLPALCFCKWLNNIVCPASTLHRIVCRISPIDLYPSFV